MKFNATVIHKTVFLTNIASFKRFCNLSCMNTQLENCVELHAGRVKPAIVVSLNDKAAVVQFNISAGYGILKPRTTFGEISQHC